jgi:hypothetical protein
MLSADTADFSDISRTTQRMGAGLFYSVIYCDMFGPLCTAFVRHFVQKIDTVHRHIKQQLTGNAVNSGMLGLQGEQYLLYTDCVTCSSCLFYLKYVALHFCVFAVLRYVMAGTCRSKARGSIWQAAPYGV